MTTGFFFLGGGRSENICVCARGKVEMKCYIFTLLHTPQHFECISSVGGGGGYDFQKEGEH